MSESNAIPECVPCTLAFAESVPLAECRAFDLTRTYAESQPEPFTYDGAECISGSCAFCNPEHPQHAEACAEFDALIGVVRGR